jgi:hypothetical protein
MCSSYQVDYDKIVRAKRDARRHAKREDLLHFRGLEARDRDQQIYNLINALKKTKQNKKWRLLRNRKLRSAAAGGRRRKQ